MTNVETSTDQSADRPSRPEPAWPFPVRAITRGQDGHWFGYYDKRQMDSSGRFVLGMAVDFEGRSPRPDDAIRLGMVDLRESDRWIEFGDSRAWCWQQGCMLQWIPGSDRRVIWNDREGGRYVCRILDIESGARRTLPFPVYALAPDGVRAVSADFRRLGDTRPGYGYVGIPDPNRDLLAPDDSGIWLVDLEAGAARLIVSVAQVAAIPWAHFEHAREKQWFNHLLVNPDGTRFVFLHRWKMRNGSLCTRMLSAGLDGTDIRVVNDSGAVSHFIWRDPDHILMFAKTRPDGSWGYVLVNEKTGAAEPVLATPHDGHCVYLPGNEWMVTDTYPQGPERMIDLYAYHIVRGTRRTLGRFRSPPEYEGEWRCDLHPRVSPDGRSLVIDSVHGGNGRQMYRVELDALENAEPTRTREA